MVRAARRFLILIAGGLLALAHPACAPEAGNGGDTAVGDNAVGDNAVGDAAVKVAPDSLFALSTRMLNGDEVDLASYTGKVCLLVNVASECGLTPQYEGLQRLQDELGGDDFTILAFPSNDFGGQEPGTPEQIEYFCTANYGVDFPMFEKVQTKGGEGQSPVYAKLLGMTDQLPSWNFSKYLISRDGLRATFFDPRTDPGDPALRAAIEVALAE